MSEKDMGITEVRGAKANISDLVVYGDGDTFALLCKASSQEQGWMKSTKVCNVEDGCIVQVTTQQRNPDGSYAVAEALTYVPNMNIDTDAEPRRLEPIYKKASLRYEPTEADIARDERYKYGEYLQMLLEVQRSGHDVHTEINEMLAKMQTLMFKPEGA